MGIEPIAVELSGGQFLQPVQTLVATSIFSVGENAIRFSSALQIQHIMLQIIFRYVRLCTGDFI